MVRIASVENVLLRICRYKLHTISLPFVIRWLILIIEIAALLHVHSTQTGRIQLGEFDLHFGVPHWPKNQLGHIGRILQFVVRGVLGIEGKVDQSAIKSMAIQYRR